MVVRYRLHECSCSTSTCITTLPVFVFLLWWTQKFRNVSSEDLWRSSSPPSCSEQGYVVSASGQLSPYLSLENNLEQRFSSLYGEPVSVLHYFGEKVFPNLQFKPQKQQFLVTAPFMLFITTGSVTLTPIQVVVGCCPTVPQLVFARLNKTRYFILSLWTTCFMCLASGSPPNCPSPVSQHRFSTVNTELPSRLKNYHSDSLHFFTVGML